MFFRPSPDFKSIIRGLSHNGYHAIHGRVFLECIMISVESANVKKRQETWLNYTALKTAILNLIIHSVVYYHGDKSTQATAIIFQHPFV